MAVENIFQRLINAERIVVLSNIDPASKIAFITALASLISKKYNDVLIVDLSSDRMLSNSLEGCPVAQAEFTSKAPKINYAKCKLCGKCASFCLGNVIKFDRNLSKVLVDIYHCTDCGECYKSCGMKNAIIRSDYKVGAFEVFNYIPSIKVLRNDFRRKIHLLKSGKSWLDEYSSKSRLIIDLDPNVWGKNWINPDAFLLEFVDSNSSNSNVVLPLPENHLSIKFGTDQLPEMQSNNLTDIEEFNELIKIYKEYKLQKPIF